jgi:hypothetical protein
MRLNVADATTIIVVMLLRRLSIVVMDRNLEVLPFLDQASFILMQIMQHI